MVRRMLLLFLLATQLHAQAPPSFAQGVLAFEQKRWKDAEALMRETIATNPKESSGTVSVSGSWFETYVPHYFLARALAKQGKCDEATKEFAESERQGVTPAIPDFAKYLQTRGGCKPQAKVVKPKEVVFETTVPFGEEEPAAPAPVAPKRVDPRPRLRAALDSYVHGRYDEAVRAIANAELEDRAAKGEAALIRAAARHALYRIGGEKDAGLLAQIEADLREYRALRPNGKPDERLFPPGFLARVR
jgi:tetratricopeptide (TPR) repeat protein